MFSRNTNRLLLQTELDCLLHRKFALKSQEHKKQFIFSVHSFAGDGVLSKEDKATLKKVENFGKYMMKNKWLRIISYLKEENGKYIYTVVGYTYDHTDEAL